jgi:membrane-associated phospholipid phosphatase
LRIWLLALTDFGDAAILTPLAAAMLLWLLLRNSRSAAWWTISVGFCVGLTAVLKIFFYGCPPSSDMSSPSGHTGFSVLVYGAIALVYTTQARGLRRALAAGIGAGLVLTIAASRLLLEIHSLPEVGLGLVIGTVSLILFGRIYLQSPQMLVWPLLVAAGMLVTILHGQELHAEEFLHRITGYLRVHCS